jgi:hypothetical protein
MHLQVHDSAGCCICRSLFLRKTPKNALGFADYFAEIARVGKSRE